jgi:hypothetical protein
MESKEITEKNFNQTMCKTLQSYLLANEWQMLYLDSHRHNGKNYFTVSLDESLLSCFDNRKEAKAEYQAQIIKRNGKISN